MSDTIVHDQDYLKRLLLKNVVFTELNISAIECYRRSISLENIQRIADALEIDAYKLFMEERV